MKLKKKTLRNNPATPKRKKRKPYFGKAEHNAIIKYQDCDCQNHKNSIYESEIRPAFTKLTENLIFIHGFASDKENFNILKSDCISFLYETLQKFDPHKGSKAFSYFNVCAKNFLIIQNKKKNKRKIRNVNINDENLSSNDKSAIENYQVVKSQESMMILKEDKKIIFDLITEIKSKSNNANEKKCIDAIETIFKNIEQLDYLNKRAIFVYLRELSGLNAKQLSVAMSNIRKHYKHIKKNNHMFLLFSDDLTS
jgi:peroxiredoxin